MRAKCHHSEESPDTTTEKVIVFGLFSGYLTDDSKSGYIVIVWCRVCGEPLEIRKVKDGRESTDSKQGGQGGG